MRNCLVWIWADIWRTCPTGTQTLWGHHCVCRASVCGSWLVLILHSRLRARHTDGFWTDDAKWTSGDKVSSWIVSLPCGFSCEPSGSIYGQMFYCTRSSRMVSLPCESSCVPVECLYDQMFSRTLASECFHFHQLLPGVLSHVLFQTHSESKSFSTNQTAEWFLSCVSSQVSAQISTVTKYFPTFRAVDRFLTIITGHLPWRDLIILQRV